MRVLLPLVLAFVLCTPLLAYAIDKDYVVVFNDDMNPPSDVVYYLVVWSRQSGPPYTAPSAEFQAIMGARNSTTLLLTGLSVGETLYWNAAACNAQGCSPWGLEIPVTVTDNTPSGLVAPVLTVVEQ